MKILLLLGASVIAFLVRKYGINSFMRIVMKVKYIDSVLETKLLAGKIILSRSNIKMEMKDFCQKNLCI